MGMSQEELAAKLAIEIAEAEKHRKELEEAAGKQLSFTELMLLWVQKGKGDGFREDWEDSRSPTNLWGAGIKRGHPPTFWEAWQHHEEHANPEHIRHHRPL